MWGMNYHRPSDSVVGLSIDGTLFALDRTTGAPTAAPLQLPCSPAKGNDTVRPPAWAVRLGDAQTDAAFGKLDNGRSVFSTIVDVVFGGGFCVSNFFSVDPNTGLVHVAATAADALDGAEDGVSEHGALYLLDIVPSNRTGRGPREPGPGEEEEEEGGQPGHPSTIRLLDSFLFPGGTGSTPTMNADSTRMFVSDDNHNVIALTPHLDLLWSVNVGDQVAASVAVAPDGDIYAVTKTHVIKLRETSPRSGAVVWRADLSTAFPGWTTVNALTPTITANGVAVSVGAVVNVGTPWRKDGKSAQLLLKVGVGLLDRQTGSLRYFAEGREESIAVMVVGSDGAYYTAGSPVRRAISLGLWGTSRLPPLVGGISRYKPIRLDVLLRDAACAAAARAQSVRAWTHAGAGAGAATVSAATTRASAIAEARQVAALVQQALGAWHAHQGELRVHGPRGPLAQRHPLPLADGAVATRVHTLLQQAAGALVPVAGQDLPGVQALLAAAGSLDQVCEMFE